jgi:nucleotide-binding universal stress UspA family protein
MMDPKKILVAIDDFNGLEPLISYVAGLADGSDRFHVHLFHAAGPLPPQLLESPGAENAAEEIKVEQEQEKEQEHWALERKAKTMRLLDNQKLRLAANLPEKNISVHFTALYQRSDLVGEIINVAQQNSCGTIIVGHESFGWLREQFHSHISEKLISDSPSAAVCVVKN